jgi:hypothetical protein
MPLSGTTSSYAPISSPVVAFLCPSIFCISIFYQALYWEDFVYEIKLSDDFCVKIVGTLTRVFNTPIQNLLDKLIKGI